MSREIRLASSSKNSRITQPINIAMNLISVNFIRITSDIYLGKVVIRSLAVSRLQNSFLLHISDMRTNILCKQWLDGPPALSFGEGPTAHNRTKLACYEILHRAADWAGSF